MKLKLSKSEKWIAGLCLATIVLWLVCGYMKFRGVPGAMLPFVFGAILAIVAVGIEMEEWPFSIWLTRQQPDKPPVANSLEVRQVRVVPTFTMREEAALETPAFQRCNRAAAIQQSLDTAFAPPQEVAQQKRVDEVVVTVRGGRHR